MYFLLVHGSAFWLLATGMFPSADSPAVTSAAFSRFTQV
jgi:hypothetical protein